MTVKIFIKQFAEELGPTVFALCLLKQPKLFYKNFYSSFKWLKITGYLKWRLKWTLTVKWQWRNTLC